MSKTANLDPNTRARLLEDYDRRGELLEPRKLLLDPERFERSYKKWREGQCGKIHSGSCRLL